MDHNRHSITFPPSLHINNKPIQNVPTFTYLGITLDPKLTLNEHVKKCVGMANHKLHVLRKVRPLLTPFAAQQIYKVIILPLTLAYRKVAAGLQLDLGRGPHMHLMARSSRYQHPKRNSHRGLWSTEARLSGMRFRLK